MSHMSIGLIDEHVLAIRLCIVIIFMLKSFFLNEITGVISKR